MRHAEYGRYPAQQADFDARNIQGDSFIIDNGGSNSDDAGALNGLTLPAGNKNALGGRTFIRVKLLKLRTSLGHTPVIVRAALNFNTEVTSPSPTAADISNSLFRLVTLPDLNDASRRYADVSAGIAWGGDANIYCPVPGIDHLATPCATLVIPAGLTNTGRPWFAYDLKDELAYCLQANKDLWLMMCYTTIGSQPAVQSYVGFVWKYTARSGYYAYLSVDYFEPIEFFGCKADASIDLMKLLDNSTGLDLNSLYLGAVEVSQTSTPVPCRVKNIGNRVLPHLEIWDDRPEWSTPAADTGNAGTEALEYVSPADAALSQKYTIKFTNATDFQVIGQAYKDNSADLNPTYGTTGWSGSVGTDFIAPSGGLVIPAAAWSGTAVANDKFVVYLTGNSTDTSWAADSNDQVQIAKDNGSGAPDNATWRPICGQRTILTAAVTIDATGKTLTVRHIETTAWPNGTKVFVANATTIDEGVVTAQTATSLTITFPTASGNVYGIGDKVGSTLPVRGLGTALWRVTTGPAGASQPNAAYIPLTGALAAGFAPGDHCSIQSVDDPTLQEEFTIDTLGVDSARILASALLANDYTTGAMVIQAGSGEALVWLKIVATATTAEERKQLRLAVRT